MCSVHDESRRPHRQRRARTPWKAAPGAPAQQRRRLSSSLGTRTTRRRAQQAAPCAHAQAAGGRRAEQPFFPEIKTNSQPRKPNSHLREVKQSCGHSSEGFVTNVTTCVTRDDATTTMKRRMMDTHIHVTCILLLFSTLLKWRQHASPAYLPRRRKGVLYIHSLLRSPASRSSRPIPTPHTHQPPDATPSSSGSEPSWNGCKMIIRMSAIATTITSATSSCTHCRKPSASSAAAASAVRREL